jgi:hypothetical protein
MVIVWPLGITDRVLESSGNAQIILLPFGQMFLLAGCDEMKNPGNDAVTQ